MNENSFAYSPCPTQLYDNTGTEEQLAVSSGLEIYPALATGLLNPVLHPELSGRHPDFTLRYQPGDSVAMSRTGTSSPQPNPWIAERPDLRVDEEQMLAALDLLPIM